MSPLLQLGPVRVDCEWNPPTRVVVLLGSPVAHSLSPAMQTAAFRAAGVDAVYAGCDVAPDALAAVLADLRSGVDAGWILGANVTVPHKQAVVPHVDALDPSALLAGAVNTLFVPREAAGGRATGAIRRPLHGANTDVAGLVAALAEIGASLSGARLVVLGAGGMARAAVAAALQEGAREIRVAARQPGAAQGLLDDLSGRWRGRTPLLACAALEAAAPALAVSDILVQATTLGRNPEELPVGLEAAPAGLAVLDAVYAPGGTPLVRAARARGLRAADGRALLAFQGAAAFELWTGRTAPVAAMRALLGL